MTTLYKNNSVQLIQNLHWKVQLINVCPKYEIIHYHTGSQSCHKHTSPLPEKCHLGQVLCLVSETVVDGTKVPARCLVEVDPRIFAIWDGSPNEAIYSFKLCPICWRTWRTYIKEIRMTCDQTEGVNYLYFTHVKTAKTWKLNWGSYCTSLYIIPLSFNFMQLRVKMAPPRILLC